MFDSSSALELAYIAVEEALRLKASFADARYEAVWRERVVVSRAELELADASTERGLAVRVLHGGAWGFAAVAEPTRHDVGVAVRRAVELARAAAILQERPVELAPQETQRGVFRTSIRRDPMGVPLADKVTLLTATEAALREGADRRSAGSRGKIIASQAIFHARRRRGVYVSSEGAEIEQDVVYTGLGLEALAGDGDRLRRRSLGSGSGIGSGSGLGDGAGLVEGRGWEMTEELPLEAEARRVGAEALELLDADPCPEGPTSVVLDAPQVAAHLAFGLAPLLELDRVIGLGPEGGGGTFLEASDLGGRRIGSACLNVSSSATEAGGAGSFGFDDEGVPADRFELVREGRLAGYLSSRETAARVGLDRSQGCMRAASWVEPPRPRPTNLMLEPGEAGDLEALVGATERGVLMDGPRAFSIDPGGRTFVATCESGWLIEGGRRTRRLYEPSYRGATEAFWGACEAVGDRSAFALHGFVGEGGLPIGVGAAPARFSEVEVGTRSPRLVEVPADGPLPLAPGASAESAWAPRGFARGPRGRGRRPRPRRDVK